MYYLGCQCSRQARRLGYAHEMAALQVRHRRCRAQWGPHLQATRQSLLLAAGRVQQAGDAIIIGGGSLQDIPVIELLAHFQRIYLLDVVFTWATRRIAKRFPGRIYCCHLDTTGVIAVIAQDPLFPVGDLVMASKQPQWPTRPVWLASVNVLSQLPLLPASWLQQHGASEEALESLASELIGAHLQQLMHCGVSVCLITETQTRRYDRADRLITVTDGAQALKKFQANAQCLARWNWDVNPYGEMVQGLREASRVEAWIAERDN